MPASKIQCHSADLNNAVQQFTRQSEGTQQLLRTVQNCLQQLQGGAWRGKGANTFYAELEREVLPGVQRLISALRAAQHSALGNCWNRQNARQARSLWAAMLKAMAVAKAMASLSKPQANRGSMMKRVGKHLRMS
ncbi:MAG: hypothetical protein DYG88_14500 [Chloroflexi bacterium CFX4]|nr:hypothetical protein [Chloroflexi bacterium CFX4]MDL1923816.1 hypothetical protein [Chloroflexi bacterium CFX3]